MKQNYKTHKFNQLILLVALLIGTLSYSQNIKFTFMNAENTNDGTNDYYEADIMIQTIGGYPDFKLGSGQTYFNYNEAAFGANVKANSRFIVTQPDGYICGQGVDATNDAKIYGGFVVNDNTNFRVSWAFTQTFAASTFANPNVTATPAKMIHIKFQYIDATQAPNVAFENDNVILDQVNDQYYDACGPFAGDAGAGPFASVDCTTFPQTHQFVGCTYDNTNADPTALGVDQNEIANTYIKIYPNPASDILYINSLEAIKSVEIFDLLGKQVLHVKETTKIEVSQLPTGVYLIKASTEKGSVTKKIMIE